MIHSLVITYFCYCLILQTIESYSNRQEQGLVGILKFVNSFNFSLKKHMHFVEATKVVR